MVKLTRAGVALGTAGLSLLGLGMGMANLELLVLASIPLLLVVTSLSARANAAPSAARTLSTRAPRRGDVVQLEVRAAPGAGSAILELHQPVPPGFRLDEGTNVALLVGDTGAPMRFRLRAHARGAHTLQPARAERIDPRGLLAPEPTELGNSETVEVTPRSFHAERLRRHVRGRARILVPDREEARAGVGSTDFRELRDYFWGDPPRSINWKATARRLSTFGGHGRSGQAPLVNEYEKEGRSTVLILLDGSAEMRVGTSLETGLDHAVEAALGAARLMLAHGARVGAATFGARSAAPAPPDAGSGQLPSLERALSPGEADPAITPSHAMRALERHLGGSRPVILVVTRLTTRNAGEVVDLVRRVRVVLRERRRALPVWVVDVHALELTPTPGAGWEAARHIVETEDAAAAREVARSGARIVPWRPAKEDFRTALFRRALA